MAKVRLPVIADLNLEDFSGATITETASYTENAMVEVTKVGTSEKPYLTQRPSIDLLEDASVNVSTGKGRGMYYWSTSDSVYFVNDDKIYKGDHSNAVHTIASGGGTEKVYFFEVGSLLIMVDPTQNELHSITSAGTPTVTKLTDGDIPSTIAHGGAYLDGYLFILDDTGTIYHSDFEDATSWNALNFIKAARENDGGVYLGKHQDHIVAFGSRSIEFFYNAGNPTGSILNKRTDIFLDIGCAQPNAVFENGNEIIFVGKGRLGGLTVYKLKSFREHEIATPSLATYLTNAVTQNEFSVLGCGIASQGHDFYLMTMYTTPSTIEGTSTLVYDSGSGLWGTWSSALTEWSALNGIPLIGWSIATSTFSRFGEGILVNGDRVTIRTNYDPIDSFASQYYIENQSDYIATDYYEVYGDEGQAITLKTRIGHIDHEINNNKFIRALEIIGDYTSASSDITIKWSDTSHTAGLSAGRTIDMSKRNKLTRLGKSNRRNYQLEYSGSEIIRLEGIEITVDGGEV